MHNWLTPVHFLIVRFVCCSYVYLQHTERGKGAVVKITSPLHINVSIAMIRALNDAMRVVNDIDDKRREVIAHLPPH